MYKVYLKQAWALMGQNRFFTAVYIIGTGLAISMVMVMAVVYHIRTANIAPEVNRDRMCYVTYVSFRMNDDKGMLNSNNGCPIWSAISSRRCPARTMRRKST